ncbi:hypothetical protein [Bacillus sp. JCM 19041]|uniref:hypothetical protein n=1 Tax=Bacillus sp. JCM 19041 TaxID=1460637 RepID=UPI0006D0AA47
MNKELFTTRQIEAAVKSYLCTLEKAKKSNDSQTVEDMNNRLSYLTKLKDVTIDYSRLTITNSHGDYYTSQIICQGNQLVTIDWTDASRLPACWEVIMSFAYADPNSKSGKIDAEGLKRYVNHYQQFFKLNAYDLSIMPYLYFFQLAVSNFYEPYEDLPEEYLDIARLTTRQLSWLNEHVDELAVQLLQK